MLPLRLRTLEVRGPPRPETVAPDSLFKDTLAANCSVPFPGFPDRMATITGRVKGAPGRTAVGGVISKVMPYSWLELPLTPLVATIVVVDLGEDVGAIELIVQE